MTMTIDDDTPLRLADAIPLAFPPGSGMTVSGLRKEAARGNLTIERIANKDFVTLRAIREMRERCRILAKPIEQITGTKVSPAGKGRSNAGPRAPGIAPDMSPRDAFLARLEARKRER